MRNYLFYFLIVILYNTSLLVSNAQSNVSLLNVRGIVYERETLDPLPGATVQLLDSKNKIIQGVVTDSKGNYLLKNVPSGAYTMKVTFLGFDTQVINLKLPVKSGNFKAADILLREKTTVLAETVITAKAIEMTVVEDTVMYNANAFTVAEGSAVEELVKKLPGVEIDEDGKVTVNGKEVSQILVDGKEFFGNDKDITLKNLPADIVDKIKAYEKKSDQARITGIDDGQEKTVIDLTIKKDRKKGWFGNVDLGYGTSDRYSGRVMANRFTSERRFSSILNANNTRNGGRRADQSAGFNLNINRKKYEIGGNVRLNSNQTKNDSWGSSQSFENVNAAYSNWISSSRSKYIGYNMDFKIEWRPDSLTTLMFQPNISLGKNSSNSRSESASFDEDPYSINGIDNPLQQLEQIKDDIGVNHNLRGNNNSSNSLSGRATLLYNRRFTTPGRNISFRIGGGWGNNDSESSSYSQIDYYQIMAMTGEDSVYHKIQYNSSPNDNHNVSANVAYSEPLNSNTFLQFHYTFNYRYQNTNRLVSSIFDPAFEQWDIVLDNYREWQHLAQKDVDQCRFVENKYYNHDIRLQVLFNRTKYRLNLGVNIQPQTSVVDYNKGLKSYDLGRTVVNAAPTIDYRYRFSREEQLQFKYRGNTGQPNIMDLVPDTLDNANPLYIRLGNAELAPSFTHDISADYRNFISEKQRSYSAYIGFRTTQNAVSNKTEYNEQTGGRITRPENINGNWNASANFNFNTAFADRRFRINTHTNAGYTNAVGYVYQSASNQTVKNKTNNISLRQNLRTTFRNEWLEVSLTGSIRYNHSQSTATAASNLDTYVFNYGGSSVIKFPYDIEYSTDIVNNCRRGYSDPAMNIDELLWNMQLSKRFLKGNAATISLRWQDVLNQRSSVDRRIDAFSRRDTWREEIRSYCMLRFQYRFNFFGGKPNNKDMGKRRNFKS